MKKPTKIKKASVYNDAGVKTGVKKEKMVYESPVVGRSLYKTVKTTKPKRGSGMSASGLGGVLGGGVSKIGKGKKVKSKSGSDCFKGGKGCGPGK